MADNHDIEPLLTTQQNDLSLTFADANSIDAKALAMLAIDVAVLIFIGQAGLENLSWWLYALLIGPLIIALALGAWAIWPRHYYSASVDLTQHPEYLALDREDLILQLLTDTIAATANNTAMNAERIRLFLTSIAFMAIGVGVLFAILIL